MTAKEYLTQTLNYVPTDSMKSKINIHIAPELLCEIMEDYAEIKIQEYSNSFLVD